MNEPRFADEFAPVADITDWKNKLALATTHLHRTQALRSEISKDLSGNAKWYREMTQALAEAIRFKSSSTLERDYGPTWERELEKLKPIDDFNASLDNWRHARAEERNNDD